METNPAPGSTSMLVHSMVAAVTRQFSIADHPGPLPDCASLFRLWSLVLDADNWNSIVQRSLDADGGHIRSCPAAKERSVTELITLVTKHDLNDGRIAALTLNLPGA